MITGFKTPIALTFIAPARRCNQRCPACILDRVGEPVRDFTLTPEEFALAVEQCAEAGVPILSVSFQGYEVTLPESWPYLEAVFAVAKRLGIRRSFVTNGMLLHKWTDRIDVLEPCRIVISLDGADPASNDKRRGLPGAFHTTLRSLGRFQERSSDFAESLKVASTVYDEGNFVSLLRMPALLTDLGIRRWALSVELHVEAGAETPTAPRAMRTRWLRELTDAAHAEGITVEAIDTYGFLNASRPPGLMEAIYQELLVRIEPAGFVRVGEEIVQTFMQDTARRFHPRENNILDAIDYAARAGRVRDRVAGLKGASDAGRIDE